MTLQHDIQSQIDDLPVQQRKPLMVLLDAVATQSQERFSNKEIEQRVEAAARQVLEDQSSEN